jgi:hypothetical protein
VAGIYVPQPYTPGAGLQQWQQQLVDSRLKQELAMAAEMRRRGDVEAQRWGNIGKTFTATLADIAQNRDVAKKLELDAATRAEGVRQFDAKMRFEQDQLEQSKAVERARLAQQTAQMKREEQTRRDAFATQIVAGMNPKDRIDPDMFRSMFAGTPSAVRFGYDTGIERMLPADTVTGEAPGPSPDDQFRSWQDRAAAYELQPTYEQRRQMEADQLKEQQRVASQSAASELSQITDPELWRQRASFWEGQGATIGAYTAPPRPTDEDKTFADWRLTHPSGTRADFAQWQATIRPNAQTIGYGQFNLNEVQQRIAAGYQNAYLSAPQTTQFFNTANAFNTIRSAGTMAVPTGASDLAMIYASVKMNDPNSAVLNGEKMTVENARSVPESIRTQFNNWLSGSGGDQFQLLTPEQRRTLYAQAQTRMSNAQQMQRNFRDSLAASATASTGIPAEAMYPKHPELYMNVYDQPGNANEKVPPNWDDVRKQQKGGK